MGDDLVEGVDEAGDDKEEPGCGGWRGRRGSCRADVEEDAGEVSQGLEQQHGGDKIHEKR